MPNDGAKVQSSAAFKKDLLTAARGGDAPKGADGVVAESVGALMCLLTPENRELLRRIRDEEPPRG